VPRRHTADAGEAEGRGEADLPDTEEDAAGVDTDGSEPLDGDPLDEDGGVQEREVRARPVATKDRIERMHRGLGRKG